MEKFAELFLGYADQLPEYAEACSIVLSNSLERSWLIGGFIYRTLAMELYGSPKPEVDLDFIIEAPAAELTLPQGWRKRKNHFGNWKLIGPNFNIDFVPLSNVHSILVRNLTPSIENFLTGTPLTIQSLAFELKSRTLLGEVGIQALLSQTVAVHHQEAARSYSERYGKPINTYLQEKASSLGFRPELAP